MLLQQRIRWDKITEHLFEHELSQVSGGTGDGCVCVCVCVCVRERERERKRERCVFGERTSLEQGSETDTKLGVGDSEMAAAFIPRSLPVNTYGLPHSP